MARNLRALGGEVRAWNRSEKSEWPDAAESPAACADACDAVIVCVSDDSAVREVILGDAGVLQAERVPRIVVDSGTTSLDLTRELAAAASQRGSDFVSAPVTGSKLGAESGNLTFMVAGPARATAALKPVFEALGKHTVELGDDPRLAQSAKLALNMGQAVILEGLLEAYTLARKLGVPLAKIAETFENSAGRTGVGVFKTPYLQRADYSPHFRLDLMQKDVHLALAEASKHRLALPAAHAVVGVYDQGAAEGWGGEDFLALARLLERWGGVQLRDE